MTKLQIELNECENKFVPSLSDGTISIFQTLKGDSLRFMATLGGSFDNKVFIFYSDEDNRIDKDNGDDKILLEKVEIAKQKLCSL